MPRLSPIFLIVFSLAGFSIACQSEDEKRAALLRKKMHQDIKQVEAVNNQILDVRKALYELRKEWENGRYAPSDLKSLEEGRAEFPAELADLQSKINITPNPSLHMLSRGIEGLIGTRQHLLTMAEGNLRAYKTIFHPDAIEAGDKRWRESWRPKIFSGRPEGPLVFGPDGEPLSPSTKPERQNK